MTSQEAQNHGAPSGHKGGNQGSARDEGASRIRWSELARRARDALSGFPSNLADQMKTRPYRTVGVATALGVGIGVLLGSRILRTVLTSVLSYAVVEVVRVYVRDRSADPGGTPIVRA